MTFKEHPVLRQLDNLRQPSGQVTPEFMLLNAESDQTTLDEVRTQHQSFPCIALAYIDSHLA